MRRLRTVALLLLVLVPLAACMSDEEYKARTQAESDRKVAIAQKRAGTKTPSSKREQRADMQAQQVGGRSGLREGASRLTKDEAPFVRMSGYVVRGTDESSFVKCGDSHVHYTRMSAEAVGHIVQRYRFRASMPLSPVYFTVNARIIEDTVNVGDHRYDSVVEIQRVYPERPDEKPACSAPSRGSLIERQVSLAR